MSGVFNLEIVDSYQTSVFVSNKDKLDCSNSEINAYVHFHNLNTLKAYSNDMICNCRQFVYQTIFLSSRKKNTIPIFV